MSGRSLKHLPDPDKSQSTPVSWCGRLEDPVIREGGTIESADNVNCGFCIAKLDASASTTTTTT